MILVHRVRAILKWLFRRKSEEQQLDTELQTFVEFSAAEKIREGVPPEEARRLARLEIGGIEQVKERVRTGRRGGLLDDLGRDVRWNAHHHGGDGLRDTPRYPTKAGAGSQAGRRSPAERARQ